jgi:hypothetical protein
VVSTVSAVVASVVVLSALLMLEGRGVDVGITSGVGCPLWFAEEDEDSPLSTIKNHKASSTATNNNARRTPSIVRLA